MRTIFVFYAEKNLSQLPMDVESVEDAISNIPEGVYTAFPIYPGDYVLRFGKHLKRLRRSAEALNFEIHIREPWLREILKEAVLIAGLDGCRALLIITPSNPSGTYIIMEKFAPPDTHILKRGVHVGLARSYISRPQVKNTEKIQKRRKLFRRFPDVYEVLLYNNEGQILEGASSSFYGVIGQRLRTAEESILKGISRGVLLDAAEGIISVVKEPVHTDNLNALREALLTSSSRGVVPIVEINGIKIGEGEPGPVVSKLREAYEGKIDEELEELWV